MHKPPEIATRELDRRTNDGIEVALLWDPQTNRVSVVIEDERSGESFELEVDAADARAAFQHPYAYSRRTHRRIDSHPLGDPMGRRW